MKRRTAVTLALLSLVVAIGASGYSLGEAHAAQATWHTGRGYFGEHEVSVPIGDWTYGFQDSVPSWIDSNGSVHDGGWPDCLKVPAGTRKVVRFAEVSAEAAGVGSRTVVMVDCRQP